MLSGRGGVEFLRARRTRWRSIIAAVAVHPLQELHRLAKSTTNFNFLRTETVMCGEGRAGGREMEGGGSEEGGWRCARRACEGWVEEGVRRG